MALATGRLSGKVAIVTGAARGLGAACALVYGRAGAVVVAVSESGAAPAAVGALIEAEGGEAVALGCDVADPDSVEDLVRTVRSRFGRIDVLVNHAVVHERGGVSGIQPRHWRRLVDVNLHGAFYCAREVVPTMIGQHSGSIVHVSLATGDGTDAVASRALEALSAALAAEQAGNGIAVNVLAADPVLAGEQRDNEGPVFPPGALEHAEAAVRLGCQTPQSATGLALDPAAVLARLGPPPA